MAINNKVMQSKMFSKQIGNYAVKETRYPGFNEKDIKKLENMTKDITNPDEKQDTMDQLYRGFYDTVQNEHKLEERSKLLNQQAYEVGNIADPEQKKQAQTKLKLSELAQQVKKTYKINANANDGEVLNLFISQTPDGQQLLENYINNGDKTLLYVGGLEQRPEEKPEETTAQKIGDVATGFISSPGKYGYNLVGQWMDRLGQKVAEGLSGTQLAEWINDKVKDGLKEQGFTDKEIKNMINEYVEERENQLEEGTAFKGREQTDIRTPILGEERAENGYTKAGEILGDIASSIALTAPLSGATVYKGVPLATRLARGAGEGLIGGEIAKLGGEGELMNLKESGISAGLGAMAGWLSGLGKVGKDSLKKEVSPYIERSIKPTVKGKQSQAAYDKFIDDTIDSMEAMVKNKDLIQYTDDAGEIVQGQLPTTLRETSEAIQSLKRAVYQSYDDIAKQAGDKGAVVKLDKVIDRLNELKNDKAFVTANSNIIKVIDDKIDDLANAGTMNIDEAQQLTQYLNKQLTAFFKNPNLNDVSKNAVIAQMNKGVKEAINSSLDDTLGSAIQGGSSASQEYTQLKQLYGKLTNIEDEVSKRALVSARQNAKGLGQTVLDSLAGGDIAEALLTMNAGKLARGTTLKFIGTLYRYLNSTDRNLSQAFNTIEKALTETATKQGGNVVKNVASKVVNPAMVSAAEEILDND